MGQLTLKELDVRLDDLEGRITTLGETQAADIAALQLNIQVIGDAFVVVDELFENLGDPSPLPLNIVRAIIEALHGVRLQRAGEYAIALEEEYFPVIEVEEVEED